MKRLQLAGFLLAMTLGISGCAAPLTTYTQTPPEAYAPYTGKVFDASFDTVWAAVVASVEAGGFALDAVSRDTGSITLSFSVDDPAGYIDCGAVIFTTDDQAETVRKAGKHAMFTVWSGGPTGQPARRDATLAGKATLVLTKEGDGRTAVTVSAQYAASFAERYARWAPVNGTGVYQMHVAETDVTFTTGQTGTSEDGNTECVTKYALEQKLLDGIATTLGK